MSGRRIFALMLCLAAPAVAAAPVDDMAEASARIAKAGQDLSAAVAPEARIAALTTAIASYQAALDVLRAGVDGASGRERDLALDLEARRDEIQHLIAALETMGRTPPPAQALHPQGPVGAARAAAMMSRLTPTLQSEADALSAEYADMAAIRDLRLRGERDLTAGIAALGAARAELAETLARRAPPPPRGTEDPAIAAMVRDSDTLTALASKLAAQPGMKPASAGAPAGPPILRRPVEGRIARSYQAPDAAGVRRPGVMMAAPPLSLVSAPSDAIVRYAGPFLDYGYVVVLEADDDTLVVLAGLAQLQVSTGDPLRAGDLVGLLGGPAFEAVDARDADTALDEPVDGAGVGAGSGTEEMLYVEIRHGQGPVDPETLFAGENG